jgi:hypothetical protein
MNFKQNYFMTERPSISEGCPLEMEYQHTGCMDELYSLNGGVILPFIPGIVDFAI